MFVTAHAVRGLVRRAACWILAVAWLAAAAHAQTARFDEHEVKAVFLFNFVQFVEWPTTAFRDPRAPVVIGVLGEDPFGRTLDEIVRGEHVRNRDLVVQRYRRLEDVGACHILFVSSSEAGRYGDILAALQHRPTLTVGDMDGFASRGGMVRFLTERSRVRFEINTAAVKAAGLTISSTLLRSATIVGGPR